MVRLQAAGAFAGTGWAVGTPTLAFLPWGVALGLATLAYQRRRAADSTVGPGRSGLPIPSPTGRTETGRVTGEARERPDPV